MSDAPGPVIDWLGGNCPVQGEGHFDGVPFYFRARGTSVRVEVGRGPDAWIWHGPSYHWPMAGWISEDYARGYIDDAYDAWRERDE